MPVSFVRKELAEMLWIYWIIRDCLAGEPAIKGWLAGGAMTNISQNAAAFNGGGDGLQFNKSQMSKARRYLPMPNAEDQSIENQRRYESYVARAIWYPVTSRTLEGMVGQIFLINPITEVPKQLEPMLKDLDGQGLSFEQSGKRATRYGMGYGRAGLWTDYPITNGAVTQQQQDSGVVKPMIKLIAPWNIVNWSTTSIEGKEVLTKVVIREECDSFPEDEDDFSIYDEEKYHVLRLDSVTGDYTVQTYDGEKLTTGIQNKANFTPGDVVTPKDAKGQSFKYIPFAFIGSENNDSDVDKPQMYDMAALNVGHYRNSADYEESSHQCGQPTVWVTGLDEQWLNTVLKGTISIGSRGGIPLPPGAQIGLLQADPNTMPLEAMKLKEDQMLAIGAKLVTQKRAQRTATEAVFDASSEGSVLTTVAVNVSSAYEFAFKAAAQFAGADGSGIKIALNTQFELNKLSPDDVSKVVASWFEGAISFTEMRGVMRKSGYAEQDDATAREEIKKDRADGMIPPATLPKGAGGGNPNPNADPAGHATNPATRGQ